jgi:Putative zinc-finger
MNCQEARELSSEYVDQRLAPAQVSLLEEHIEACPDCEDEIEALRRTISWIGSLEAIEPSPDFLDQVQRKIDKRGKPWRIWAWLFEPIRVKVPLELTALILLSITALHLYHRSPELSKEVRIPDRLESFGVAQDKLGEENLEAKRRTEKSNQMSEGKPMAAVKPEARPSIPKSPEQSQEASQQVGEAADLSGKTAPSSLQGTRIAGDKPREKSLEADERGRTAKRKAVTQPAEPSREAREVTAASKPEAHEISTDDVEFLGARIKVLLEKVGGKLLTQESASGSGLLLTVELPQHRQTEFLAALKEESNLKSKPSASRHGAFSGGTLDKPATELHRRDAGEKAQKRKVAPASESSPQTDEAMAILQLRILPKE